MDPGQQICREKLFEYTNGRFLINEAEALQKRYLKFNVDELCAIASTVGSPSPVYAVEKMEGGFNRALLMKKMDGSEVIAKLPFKIAGPPKYTTASEVAVLQYVHQHTKIPVPKVLAWSADSSNSVGAEYIIMEKAAGTQLVREWHKMSDHNHIIFIKNLCALEAELASVRFPANGALYLRESMSDGEHNIVLDDNLDPSGRYCIGPSCDRLWNATGIDPADKGPWPDLSTFGNALVNRELCRMKSNRRTPKNPSTAWRGSMSEDAEINILHLAAEVMKRIEPCTLPGKYARPVLWHTDLHMGNIYMSDDDPTEIASIIDWQGICIAPLLHQVRFPVFIEMDEDYLVGGPVPQLPANLDQMDSDDQLLERYKHKQASMAKAYESASGFKDKEIWRALRVPLFFRELFVRTGEASEEGAIPLRACLVELFKCWASAGFSGPCPVTYTHDEIEAHEREFEDYSEFHAVRAIPRKYLDTDTEGWLPTSADFAWKQEQNNELLQHVMKNHMDYGMSVAEIKRAWPF